MQRAESISSTGILSKSYLVGDEFPLVNSAYWASTANQYGPQFPHFRMETHRLPIFFWHRKNIPLQSASITLQITPPPQGLTPQIEEKYRKKAQKKAIFCSPILEKKFSHLQQEDTKIEK